MSTYLGKGLAVPHGRLDDLERPLLAFARSDEGIALDSTNERAELIFLLLTPSRMARIQPRLLADIVGLIESEYVADRLREAHARRSHRNHPRRPAGGAGLSRNRLTEADLRALSALKWRHVKGCSL